MGKLEIMGWKLFRIRKDGSIGSLFFDRRARIPLGVWLPSYAFKKKGYAFRPGWHCMKAPIAPHMVKGDDRVWAQVAIRDVERVPRPDSQGGEWFLAREMKVVALMK